MHASAVLSTPVTVRSRRRPQGGRRLVALVGLLLVASAASALAAAPARATTTAVTSGTVHWGFKQSWRTYIGEPGISVSDGAVRAGDGGFDWPVTSGSYDDVTKALELRLAGTVHFTAHDGLLDSTLRNGRLVISGEGAELRFDIRSKNMDGAWVEFTDAPLAVLDAEAVSPSTAGGSTTWAAVPTAITQQGTDAFTYTAGTTLDPLTVTYVGPGGKPDFGEHWTPGGTHRYVDTPVRELLPGITWASWIRDGLIDEAAGVLHAIGYPNGGTAEHLLSIDLTTGQIVGQAGPLVGQRYAFDPVHHTVFVGGTSTLVAYTWDPQNHTYASEQLFATAPASVLTYDPTTETVAAVDANGAVRLAKRLAGGGYTTRTIVTEAVRFVSSFLLDGRGRALFGLSRGTDRLWQLDLDEETPTAHIVPGINGAAYQQLVLGQAGEAWTSGNIASVPQLLRLVRDGAGNYSASGTPIRGSHLISALTRSPDGTRIYGVTPYYNKIQVFTGGALRGAIDTDGPALSAENKLIVEPRADGSVLVAHPHCTLARPDSIAVTWPLHRFDLSATSPTVTAQPGEETITLLTGEPSRDVTLSAAATGSPAPTVRWQSRPGGVGRFRDIAGADGTQLTIAARRADDGTEYRAVFANGGGELATDAARLTVRYAPEITQQPVSASVVAGEDALLKVMPLGNPHPVVTWQARIGGFWRALDPQDGDVELSGEGNGFLTIKRTAVEQSGTVFRAKVVNAVGTTYSNPVTLKVTAPVTEPVTFGGGHVDWGVANRWRCYVVGTVARGGIELDGGVTRVPGTTASGSLCPAAGAGSEALRFPVLGGRYDPVARTLEVKLGGTVRFWGHAHEDPGAAPALDTTFRNLRVVVAGTTGTLYADTVGATMQNPVPVTRTGVALADLDLTGVGASPTANGLSWTDVPSSLAAAGTEVLGGYPAGEPFDPVSLSLVFGTPQPDPVPDPDPVPEPGPLPDPLPQPQSDPTPTPQPQAPRKAPGIAAVVKAQTVGTARTARVATLTCSAGGACKVTAPRWVTVRIGGRSYRATVLTAKTIKAGKKANVHVRFTRAAATRLRGRAATVRVRLKVVAGTRTATRTVSVTVKRR